jgi:glycosyltransferase involved in cell wall biosynthesis
MTKEVDVSVIISTYNRCQLLAGAIHNLLAQNATSVTYEVIVVNNNSSDGTKELVDKIVAQSNVPIRYLFEPRQGLSYGLNTGIQNARGRIVALTDDDIRVERNYVVKIHEAFRDHPEVAFLGGRVLPHWPSKPPAWLTQKHWAPLALQDYGDMPFYTSVQNPVPLVNKAFRNHVFTDLGLFRPELGKVKDALGDVADHDLMVRIWHAGGRGIYMPTVVVYAEVQEERLSKGYHRTWHSNHGKFSAIMAIENLHSELFKRRIAGAPISPYRRLLHAIRAYPSAVIKRDEAEAFYYETRMRYAVNYLRMYYYRRFLTLNSRQERFENSAN